ncbi:hypothetical protein WDW89_06855 [Deltaproteobacteria bacterium TL4]
MDQRCVRVGLSKDVLTLADGTSVRVGFHGGEPGASVETNHHNSPRKYHGDCPENHVKVKANCFVN